MTEAGQALSWLDWWHSGYWLQAHPSWRDGDTWFQIPEYQQYKLARTHGAVIGRQWGVGPDSPCPPDPILHNILLLPEEQKIWLVMLVLEICHADTTLPEETKIWCERLARGVRPQNWLPALPAGTSSLTATLHLLHELFPECWTRLRMAFPREAVLLCPDQVSGVPRRRLQPVWEAAVWRCQPPVTTSTSEEPEDEEYYAGEESAADGNETADLPVEDEYTGEYNEEEDAEEKYAEEEYTEEEYSEQEYTEEGYEEEAYYPDPEGEAFESEHKR